MKMNGSWKFGFAAAALSSAVPSGPRPPQRSAPTTCGAAGSIRAPATRSGFAANSFRTAGKVASCLFKNKRLAFVRLPGRSSAGGRLARCLRKAKGKLTGKRKRRPR